MWQVNLHRESGIVVDAILEYNGTLIFDAQDLRTLGVEYEYTLTIAPGDVPLVVDALGGGTDVLALLEAHADEIYREGEKAWLDRHEIPYSFWSRVGE